MVVHSSSQMEGSNALLPKLFVILISYLPTIIPEYYPFPATFYWFLNVGEVLLSYVNMIFVEQF